MQKYQQYCPVARSSEILAKIHQQIVGGRSASSRSGNSPARIEERGPLTIPTV
jgi:hypothetical protein